LFREKREGIVLPSKDKTSWSGQSEGSEVVLKPLQPRLGIHESVPLFALPSDRGKEVKLWDYKMRKNLVIFFYHGNACSLCGKRLMMFAEHYGELVRLETEILAISSDRIEEALRRVQSFPLDSASLTHSSPILKEEP
jgi:hypothetical protein